MKSRLKFLIRFETLIIVLIMVAFSLLWIKWGKLTIYGWDLPALYKKTTKISNTIMFFTKKDSPHIAYFVYIVPALGLLSAFLIMKAKYKSANYILLLTCVLGFAVAVYMYIYFLESKIFKLSNAGSGIHLLFAVSFIGLIYTVIYCTKKKKTSDKKDKIVGAAEPKEEKSN